MSLFDTPKPPDPSQSLSTANTIANSQQEYNTAAQRGSMVDQTNPYGSLNYTQTGTGPGGVPIYSAGLNLSPENQSLVNSLMGSKNAASKQAGSLLTGANYGSTSPTDAIGGMSSGITGDIVSKNTSFLQPFFDTERTQLDTKLRNQGFLPGQPAYDNAMRGLDTSHGLTVSKNIADTTPQAYNIASSLYSMPASLASILGSYGQPVDPTKLFSAAPAVQPANVTGAFTSANQALMDAYKANLSQNQSMMSGLFGIPTALLGGWAQSGGLSGLGGAGVSGGGAAAGELGGEAAAGAGGLGDILASLGPAAFLAL